ncbi:hypothetical protein AB3662_30955 [Sorangium cellulosum]|uniref:hypothetical protein n=1 Tax=Sorangium cellulosum TaxID=56 RepID=UPI003D9A2FA2
MNAPLRLLLRPGLDGTGALSEPFLSALSGVGAGDRGIPEARGRSTRERCA